MFRVSCIQLKSNNNILQNLEKTEKLISKAVKQKSDFILTPEISSLFSLNKRHLLKICKPMNEDIYLKKIKKLAKKYKKWILVGSLIIKVSKNKLVNRSVLVDKTGKIRTYYDKIHMYDVVLSKREKYFESKSFFAGKKIKSFNLPWGKIGFSICYDLRFPHLYQALVDGGASILTVPAAFTLQTGKDHWEVLLRARAIENQCYVLASDQFGHHSKGRASWGKSLIADPWGTLVALMPPGIGIRRASRAFVGSGDVRENTIYNNIHLNSTPVPWIIVGSGSSSFSAPRGLRRKKANP